MGNPQSIELLSGCKDGGGGFECLLFFFFFTKLCSKEQCCGGVLKNNKTMGDKSYLLDTVGLRMALEIKKCSDINR
jgi:hypothetical protein